MDSIKATMAGAPRLSLRNLVKTFPGVRAVNDVTVDVWPGEIHALMGENGAGKSTLMQMVAGVYQPESGDILLDGVSILGGDERSSSEAGIAMVFQERSLVGALSVAENIFAARQPANLLGFIKRDQMEREARRILDSLGVSINPRARVETLSPGEQQMVEVAKGLSRELKVIILDEPTSSLTIKESRQLFGVLRELAARGVAVVYVSHRMDEIFELTDRLTVLKDGAVTGTRRTSEVTAQEIIALMVGRDLSFEPDSRRVADGTKVALELCDLAAAPKVHSISFALRYGEILCLAGLLGAGRTETCEAIFGVREITGGSLYIDGKEFRPASPQDSMRAGISMVPEDRKEGGLFLDFPIWANIGAASLSRFTRRGLMSSRALRSESLKRVAELRIATPDIDRAVSNLSGGNQQKVLLAKWLVRNPRILIVDEPTRGVDVGAKADIYRILRELAAEGMAILVVSSDLPEVLALAHRIIVVAGGESVADFDAGDATEHMILELATSTSNHSKVATA